MALVKVGAVLREKLVTNDQVLWAIRAEEVLQFSRPRLIFQNGVYFVNIFSRNENLRIFVSHGPESSGFRRWDTPLGVWTGFGTYKSFLSLLYSTLIVKFKKTCKNLTFARVAGPAMLQCF